MIASSELPRVTSTTCMDRYAITFADRDQALDLHRVAAPFGTLACAHQVDGKLEGCHGISLG